MLASKLASLLRRNVSAVGNEMVKAAASPARSHTGVIGERTKDSASVEGDKTSVSTPLHLLGKWHHIISLYPFSGRDMNAVDDILNGL